MQWYAKHIKRALHSQGIEAVCNRTEGLVYGLSESPFGDVYCIYRMEKDILTCFALFQPEVLPEVEKTVLTYLAELNNELGSGYFYIDNILSRVTLAVDYEVARGIDTPAFDTFCSLWFYRFRTHRQMLYWTITGHLTSTLEPAMN